MTNMISGFISGPAFCRNDIYKICAQASSNNGSVYDMPEWVFRSWVGKKREGYGNFLALLVDMYGPDGTPGFHVQSCQDGLTITPTANGTIHVQNAAKTIHEAFKAYDATEARAVISYVIGETPAKGCIHHMTAAHITLDRVAIMSSVQWINQQKTARHTATDKACTPVVNGITRIVGKIGETEPFRCINAVRALTENAVIAAESLVILSNEEQALAEATAGVEAARKTHNDAEERLNQALDLWK